jgi:hypothetical protein
MNGTEKWEQEEKVLPSLASRPAVPTLTSQFNKLMLQQQLQQMQLQQGSTMSNSVSRCGFSNSYSGRIVATAVNVLLSTGSVSIVCVHCELWLPAHHQFYSNCDDCVRALHRVTSCAVFALMPVRCMFPDRSHGRVQPGPPAPANQRAHHYEYVGAQLRLW